MKHKTIKLPELLHILAFLVYLFGSSLTHIENGAELSLWIMAFAMIITVVTTVFPWLGIHWLKLDQKGCRGGWRMALFLQVTSWSMFGYAMFFRLGRNLPRFHTLVTLTTLLWAGWLLIFIYSRHACQPTHGDDDTLEDTRSHTASHAK